MNKENSRIERALDLLRGHRTWISGTVIAGMFAYSISRLPPELLTRTTPDIPDILYALAVLIGVGKIGDAILTRVRKHHKEDYWDPTDQDV